MIVAQTVLGASNRKNSIIFLENHLRPEVAVFPRPAAAFICVKIDLRSANNKHNLKVN